MSREREHEPSNDSTVKSSRVVSSGRLLPCNAVKAGPGRDLVRNASAQVIRQHRGQQRLVTLGVSHNVKIVNRSGGKAGVLSIYVIEQLKESSDLPSPQNNIAIII